MIRSNSPSPWCQVWPLTSCGGAGSEPSGSVRFQSGWPSRFTPWQLAQCASYNAAPWATTAAGGGGTPAAAVGQRTGSRTVAGAGSLPAPPHDVSGHTWHHGDGELLRIIAEGGVVYMPESKMPGFAEVMSDDDMRAVLTFIKSSWGAEQLAWQAQITAGEVGPQAAP